MKELKKPIIENTKINKVFLIFLLLFILMGFFINNKSNKVEYFLKTSNQGSFYFVKNQRSKIILIKKNREREIIDSIILHKINNQYFQYSFNLQNKKQEKILIMSIDGDTIYNYGPPQANFYCRINKYDDNKFKSTFANYDSIKNKYRFSIYYDKSYVIKRIEFILNDSIENYY